MKQLNRFVIRRSKLAFFGVLVLVALSTIGGLQAFSALKGGGYDDPGSQSTKVLNLLRDNYNESVPEVVIIADFAAGADDETSVTTATSLSKSLKAVDGVVGVKSYYSLNRPAALRSADEKAVYFFVDLNDTAKQSDIAKTIQDKFTGDYQTAKLYVAGFAPITAELNGRISSDLARAESVAVPITIILLVFVFGSLVAVGLPFLVAIISIVGSFFVVWLLTLVTDTSVFSVNLITGLGLGLGIDYALLMVNRFREERAAGIEVSKAVENTMNTAGRTVFFSGLTVGVVLVSMAFFPQYFLRSFAWAGLSAVSLALIGALVALPALLNILGDRVNKGKVLKGDLTPKQHGMWEKLSRFVMRRPVAVLLVVLLGLGGLMSLAANAQFGLVDDRILPKDNRVVVANQIIRDRFAGREGSPVEIIVENATPDQVTDYSIALSKLPDIVRVQSTAGIAQNGQLDDGYAPAFASYKHSGLQRIVAIADVEPRSTDGYKLTTDVRALSNNFDKIYVGGSAASYTDSLLGISNQLPWAALWIVVSTLILLFLFTGSVILPIKAVILNVLSLGATLGFLTWVFQSGQLHWLIGDFTVTGTIDSSSMVMIAVMAFGLSMDYELFLLSRIKEQHDAGLSTEDSVSFGLQKSGRIITAAALVLAVSFFAFTTSSVSIMKMLGLGVGFAILLDATIVRALLVPALMRLFGEFNWWAPKWLKKIYRRVGLDH